MLDSRVFPRAPPRAIRSASRSRYAPGVALVLSLLAALAAAILWLALRAQRRALEIDLRALRGELREARTELERDLGAQRELLARVARGERVDDDMVREGRTWRDLDADAARALVERGGLTVLDVRSREEAVQGLIPGARLLPVGELPERLDEIPRDRPILVYCQAGGRSAAACELLAREGFTGLHNLADGFAAWNGPVEALR